MNTRILVLAALVGAMPACALADISFYAGAGIGGSRVEEDVNITLEAVGSSASPVAVDKFEGTDLGYRVFGGVRFWRFLGIEAGYVNLGEPDSEVTLSIPVEPGVTPVQTDVALKLTDEIDGMEIYLVGFLPFSDKWEAFAKVGMIDWDSEFTVRNAFADTYPVVPGQIPEVLPPSSVEDTDGTDLAGGIGVNYRAGEHFTLRGEGTWYDIDDTEKAWLLGFSLIYDF